MPPRFRWPRPPLLAPLGVAALVLSLGAPPAAGYEFEVSAKTLGQGYALRSMRLTTASPLLHRRRFTQMLSLNIWDIGNKQEDRRPYDRPLLGPHIYLNSYLRLDHDFGDWSTGTLVLDSQIHDALDLVPELETSLVHLDVLYAYVGVDDLADGLLHIRLGRQLDVGAMDWWSMDGLTVRVTPELPIAVQVHGGLRVRDASPAGSATFEPDGTGSAECAEYIEGDIPGSGSWRPIDLGVMIENDPYTSDYTTCPQREELMPTFGGAIELQGVDDVSASISYRRTMSPTVGLIGPVDRFTSPDTGLYPNETGQAPDWAVNEEKITATARWNHRFDGARGQITPYAGIRYDGVVGVVDEAHTGVRLRYGQHTLEPEYFYSFPTFDGDSIFNVFSIRGYHDVRLTYGLRPARMPLSAYTRVWARAFSTEDQPDVASDPDDAALDDADWAGGVQAGARYVLPRALSVRLDVFHDTGYGGTRTGGYTSLRWQTTRKTGVSARLSLVHFDERLRDDLHGFSVGVQTGVSYQINQGIRVHGMAEQTSNRRQRSRFRLLGVLEFSLVPEV